MHDGMAAPQSRERQGRSREWKILVIDPARVRRREISCNPLFIEAGSSDDHLRRNDTSQDSDGSNSQCIT